MSVVDGAEGAEGGEGDEGTQGTRVSDGGRDEEWGEG